MRLAIMIIAAMLLSGCANKDSGNGSTPLVQKNQTANSATNKPKYEASKIDKDIYDVKIKKSQNSQQVVEELAKVADDKGFGYFLITKEEGDTRRIKVYNKNPMLKAKVYDVKEILGR